MPDPTQAEREAAEVVATLRDDFINDAHHTPACNADGVPLCTCYVVERLERIEAAARAAGRAEGAEALAVAEHNQDVLARPFDAGGQMDQMQTRMEALEGALRGITEHIRYERDEYGMWHAIYSDKPLAAAATEDARALLPKASEGSD